LYHCHSVVGMIALLSAIGSLLSFRVRSRASLELELIALRDQMTVLRRQRPGRPRLFSTDRLLWTWLYRIWPQVLNTMVLVKPATVVQWHRKGFRLYWWRRSRRLGRPRMSREIRSLLSLGISEQYARTRTRVMGCNNSSSARLKAPCGMRVSPDATETALWRQDPAGHALPVQGDRDEARCLALPAAWRPIDRREDAGRAGESPGGG
jgi:hypothetical protein